MKHLKLFFALFAMLALGVGNAWAEETVVYTLTPASGSNNSYANNCDITISDITWNLTGNSQTQPWRIGGKSLTEVDRTLYSKTEMPHKVTKVEVKHGTNTTTVNSFKLIVASDANFSNMISTVDATFKASETTTLTCPSGADWSNAYYKFVYNVTVSGTSNKYLQFSEAKFYGEASTTPGEGGGEDPETPGEGGGEDPEDPTPGTGGTVTYTVSSATEVTTTGNVPKGSSASLSGTGSLNSGFIQCTNGKNHTLKLTGYEGYKITGVTIHVKSNSSKGTGSFSVVAGSTTIASIAESAFNSTNWNGSWNTTGVDKTLTMTNDSYEIQSGENVTLTINCKSGNSNYNSLYVKSYTITYMPVTSSGSGSGEPVVLLIPKNGYFDGLLLVQLLALFLQQKDSFSATLQVPPCTRW